MKLLNKDYLEELTRQAVLDTEFTYCDGIGEAVSDAEWEVDRRIARELAYLADDDLDDPQCVFYSMAEKIREEYDIDVQEYVEEMYDGNEYVHERELARVGL